MGGFINTQYNDTVDSLLGTMKDVLKSHNYKFTDKPPITVEYFHLNKEASTLDPASRLAYQNVGDDSPFWYNQIHNMVLYGIDSPMAIQYSSEEFGMEMAAIEGDAYILPNTIEPYPDDQFIITHLNKRVVFKVTHSDPDTLEDGSNMYKISYRSSTSTYEQLLQQVIDEYEFVVANVGTEINCLLKSPMVDYIKTVDNTIISLKHYYKRLFYSKRVQTFIFRYLETLFYDPYMIEFLRRHRILEGDGEYIYLQHQTKLDPLFPVSYEKTIFGCLERKDKDNIGKYWHRGAGRLIEDKFTIFYNRVEEYWEVWYDFPHDYEFLHQIPCFKDVFISHVMEGKTIQSESPFYNIIIKYLYDYDITAADLNTLDTLHFENNPTLFYAIPCIIYCLESYLKKLIVVESGSVEHTNKQ